MREEVPAGLPALNSKLRAWTSDEDGARSAAHERLEAQEPPGSARPASTPGARSADGDPLQAMTDALRDIPADEIVVSTRPQGGCQLARGGMMSGAEQRFDVPVTSGVVDLTAEASARSRRPACQLLPATWETYRATASICS